MERAQPLQVLGALGIVGGGIAIWVAFQRQMCAMGGGVGGECAPNIAYLLPGILAALVGISILAIVRRGSAAEGGG